MSPEGKVWFAMRTTFCRELDAQRILDTMGIENYIPKQYKVDAKRSRCRKLVPVIHNLIFVYTTPSGMRQLKSDGCIPYLQYIVDSRSRQKIIVPEDQMRRFIAVTATFEESLLYFSPGVLNLSKGMKVRVIGGQFEGQEGIFLKVKGARDRRVVIQIEGIMAVALATVHPDLIQVIDCPVKKVVGKTAKEKQKPRVFSGGGCPKII